MLNCTNLQKKRYADVNQRSGCRGAETMVISLYPLSFPLNRDASLSERSERSVFKPKVVYSLLHLHCLDTIALQQGVDTRLAAAELTIEVGGGLGAPSLKDMFAEEGGCLLVEDRAVLLL